jgi:uncharacterized repeat protein (TIGR01451 family)
MKNQRKKIIAVVLLVLIVVLGGASVFVASRLNTQTAVAPNAPASQPKASTACAPQGACVAGNTCPAGQTQVGDSGATDCATGQSCCAKNWVTAAACTFTATIAPPECTPRPACLDQTPVPTTCETTAPAGGYCPYLSCNKVKKIYKDVAGNTAGVYNLDATNELTGTTTTPATLYPGQMYIYVIPYTVVGQTTPSTIKSARVTDTLDSKLEYVDGVSGCTVTGTTLKTVACDINETNANIASQVAFRVKVKDTAALETLDNQATIATTGVAGNLGAARCVNTSTVAKLPTVALSCVKKSSLSEDGSSNVNTVSTDQTFQYSFNLKNNGDLAASDVIVTDVLALNKLIFVDSASGCTYDTATRKVSCKTSLAAGESKTLAFKVKTAGTLTDAEVISNKAVCKQESSPADSAGSECSRDVTVALPKLTAVKNAYKDNSNNTVGVYQLTDSINTVSKNQTFVYSIEMQNVGTGTASGVTITDPLTGLAQDQLTFVDKDPRCDWAAADKLLTCHIDIQPGAIGRIAFRTKVSDGIANGTIIKNVGKVVSKGQDLTVNKDLTVSTVVGCNNTCTSQAECQTGYVCDTTSTKCRLAACLSTESCVCPAAVTEAPTKAPTAAPTAKPTKETTIAPTKVVTAAPAELPSSGILDIPGVAAFGGGLVLAVIGLLLAL